MNIFQKDSTKDLVRGNVGEFYSMEKFKKIEKEKRKWMKEKICLRIVGFIVVIV